MTAKGLIIAYTHHSALLAHALRAGGRAEEGLRLLDDRGPAEQPVDEFVYQPELHRVRGELLLALRNPNPAEAEALFRQAIGIAQAQEAKSFELRATTSLGRLLKTQGRIEEARQMLSPVYNWFTEGFDTQDLIEAKALLGELGEGPSTPRTTRPDVLLADARPLTSGRRARQ